MLNSKFYENDLNEIYSVIKDVSLIKKSSFFITGATGLIGSAITDFLLFLVEKKGFDINITIGVRDINKAKSRFNNDSSYLTFISYDATEQFITEKKFDYIIHAASPANPSMYLSNPVETMQANIFGLNYLLKYAQKNKVKKVIYISSSEVYGFNKNEIKEFNENDYYYVDLLDSRSCYPSSKRASETLCVAYSKQYNIDISIVRPGHIFGPTALKSDGRVGSKFFFDVLKNEDIILKSSGEQRRSYCYVLDLVSAIMFVLLFGKSGEAYNIANPEISCSIKELAMIIAKYSCKKVLFSIPTEQEKKGFNQMPHSLLNSKKLQSLGWQGIFDLEKGVEHTLNILREVEG